MREALKRAGKVAKTVAGVLALAVLAATIAPAFSGPVASFYLKVNHQPLGSDAYFSAGATIDAALIVAAVIAAPALWAAVRSDHFPTSTPLWLALFIAWFPLLVIGVLGVGTVNGLSALLSCHALRSGGPSVCGGASDKAAVQVATTLGVTLLFLQVLTVGVVMVKEEWDSLKSGTNARDRKAPVVADNTEAPNADDLTEGV
jgi:hypothetical protein